MLFLRFQQADFSTTRKYGGAGLGLAISKQLIQLMGGTMGVVSHAGEGSTFSCEIPLGRGTASQAGPLPAVRLDGARALVVDDNQMCRFVTAEHCLRWGMRVEEAESGEEALRMASLARAGGDPYRLICLDHMMPDMDGAETVRRVREADPGGEARIIVVTSTGERGETRRLVGAGGDACLVKPVREAALLNAVQPVLACREAGVAPSVDVPLPPARATAPPSGEAPLYADRHVLLVEDNIVDRKVATALLGRLGCRVEVAVNGLEALEKSVRMPYDVIFMDCQMPEMDGYEATGEIRQREGAARHTPIIALTAGAMAEDRERCFQAGMDDYVSKPVSPKAIEAMLSKWAGETSGVLQG